jgi:hypothetical protein
MGAIDDLANASTTERLRTRRRSHRRSRGRSSAGSSNELLLGIASFLFPLVGFIIGAVFLTRDNARDRQAGRTCLVFSIIGVLFSVVASIIIWAVVFGAFVTTIHE